MKSQPVELDFRSNGQMDVTLLWDRGDDTIVVQVLDWATSQLFTVRPPRDRALDAFRHPFAYGEVGDLASWAPNGSLGSPPRAGPLGRHSG